MTALFPFYSVILLGIFVVIATAKYTCYIDRFITNYMLQYSSTLVLLSSRIICAQFCKELWLCMLYSHLPLNDQVFIQDQL